eukprot:132140_1
MEKNQLLNEYAKAVAEKNYYLRELHINGKLPYIEHLEKLKAEIQRQVDDVTLLDYQKDSVLLTEKNWIDLCSILIKAFEINKEIEQKDFEQELKLQWDQFQDDKENKAHKRKRKSKKGRGQTTPKHGHRKNASSMAHTKRNKHRRNSSMSNSGISRGQSMRRKKSTGGSSDNGKLENGLQTLHTLHNRETN